MGIIDDVASIVKESTEDIQQDVQQREEILKKMNSNDYSAEWKTMTGRPAADKLRRTIGEKKDATQRAVEKALSEYIEAAEAEDALNPDELTDDVKLLNLAMPLELQDIKQMLARNEGNRTMTQLILRYAKAHEMTDAMRAAGMRPIYFTKSEEARATAEAVRSTTRLYVDHWIDHPTKAADMLQEFYYAKR